MENYKSPKFKTTIGEGHCWTDNDIIRIVVEDQYGPHIFRLHAEQVDTFLKAFMSTMLFVYKNANMDDKLSLLRDSIERHSTMN